MVQQHALTRKKPEISSFYFIISGLRSQPSTPSEASGEGIAAKIETKKETHRESKIRHLDEVFLL